MAAFLVRLKNPAAVQEDEQPAGSLPCVRYDAQNIPTVLEFLDRKPIEIEGNGVMVVDGQKALFGDYLIQHPDFRIEVVPGDFFDETWELSTW